MANSNNSDAPKEPAGQTPASSPVSSPDDYLNVPGQRALPTTPARGRDATGLTTPPSRGRDSDASSDLSMNDSARSGTRGSSASGTTSQRGTKRTKKEPKEFKCTEFPPCKLTFTRSEHLARHIRKHTGERPFNCHCERTFSRLDNLRQHAQTVHANEIIPVTSLAYTGGKGPLARNRKAMLARQNNREMQPLQQGPPRAMGHRRNAHSMPVNHMPPMYDQYDDPRGDMRRTQAPNRMMDPRGPTHGEYHPESQGTYYSTGQYQPMAPYNTPPSNRSSGNFMDPYQSSMTSPAYPQYTGDRLPLRRQSIPSVNGPYEPATRSFGGPQLPPLDFGGRENLHHHQSANMFENGHHRHQSANMFENMHHRHQSANMFENMPHNRQSAMSENMHQHHQSTHMFENTPVEYSQYSQRRGSFEMPDPRRRTWSVGHGRDLAISGGIQNMNLTPPEEARERPYAGYSQLQPFERESLQLAPIRNSEETPMSPIRQTLQPSPAVEVRRYESQTAEEHEAAEHEAADALHTLSRRTYE